MEHAPLNTDVDENGMVSFGIEEDSAELICDELTKFVSTSFDPNFDGLDDFEVLIPHDVIEALPTGLGGFKLMVTEVRIDRTLAQARLVMNAMHYEWSKEMMASMPKTHTFELGKVDGPVTPSMMLVQKKLHAALEDIILTFLR